MDELLYIDQEFSRVIRIDDTVNNREFDGCTFRNCDFAQTVFRECSFIDCTFHECNFSMAQMPGTSLKKAIFTNCKLLGIRFDACNDFLFEVAFTGCALDYAWFSGKKMSKTPFRDSSLRGVNFSGTDLSSAELTKCDLSDAVFDETKLDGADLTEAYGFRIDPDFNSLKKAKFSLDGLEGLLEKYQIIIK